MCQQSNAKPVLKQKAVPANLKNMDLSLNSNPALGTSLLVTSFSIYAPISWTNGRGLREITIARGKNPSDKMVYRS